MEDRNIDSMIDAFIALRDVSDESVAGMIKQPVTEGKTFSVHNYDDMSEAQEFFDTQVNVPCDEIEVIDVDMNAFDHIKDKTSYIGQAIICCERCKSNTFIDMDKLEPSDDDPEVYNIGLECPHCHSNDAGFSLIGQVGKAIDIGEGSEEGSEDTADTVDILDNAEDDEFELEFPSDDKKASDEEEAAFDNDLEEEEPETGSDNSEEEIEIDTSLEDEEEPDGMETSETEEDEEKIEKEVTTRDGKKLKLKITKKLGDVYEEDFEKDLDKDEVNEALADEIIKDHIQDNYGEEAWKLGQIMRYMNNEDAYFGGWLYIWPDGESYEECLDDFADKEDYEDLKRSFDRNYRRYHADGLFEAPADVEAYAHEIDKQLGLEPIENLFRVAKKAERVSEAFNFKKVSNFIDLINNPQSIDKVIISKPGGCFLSEGLVAEIDPKYCGSKVECFDVGNGFLTCNIDSSCKEGNKLGSFLKRFDDDESDKVILWDMNTGDQCFQGCKKDAIDNFGDCQFCGIEAPRVLILKIESDEEAPEVVKKPIDIYLDKVYKANNLNPYAADNPATNEYWISETLRGNSEKDDMNLIFREFIEPTNNPTLIEGFKLLSEGKELTEADITESKVGSEWVKFNDFDSLVKFGVGAEWEVVDPRFGKRVYDVYSERGDFYGRVKDGVRQLKLVGPNDECIVTYDENNREIIDEAYHPLDTDELTAAVDEEWDNIIRDLGKNASLSEIETYLEEGALKEIDFDSGLLKRILRKKLISEKPEEEIREDFENLNNEEIVADSSKIEESVKSFKSRKELSEAILECKNNNRTYTVRRSSKEGYRYDLLMEDYNPDDHKYDDAEAHADDYEELQKLLNDEEANQPVDDKEAVEIEEDVDDEEALVPANRNTSALDSLSAVERETVAKIARVASDICEAVADTYQLELNPQLVAADILQDLRLISHDINPDDLPDTASNRATKEMFKSFEATMELIDDIMSFFTGETIESTPARRLVQSIRMLDGPAFSTESIRKGIASQAFLAALQHGDVPYITADQVAQLPAAQSESLEESADIEFPAEAFDRDMNEYFKANYDQNVTYITNEGKYDADGNILLEGTLIHSDDDERCDLDVNFILSPMSEEINESATLEEKLAATTYRVTNNISEEVFEFKA